MKFITKCGISLCFVTGSIYAANWSAKLLDANCSGLSAATTPIKHKAGEKLAQSCAAGGSTTSFAILADGKVYKLDSSSNEKAQAAMKNGSFKADHDGDVHATVSGSLQGDTVKVDSISGKGEHK